MSTQKSISNVSNRHLKIFWNYRFGDIKPFAIKNIIPFILATVTVGALDVILSNGGAVSSVIDYFEVISMTTCALFSADKERIMRR